MATPTQKRIDVGSLNLKEQVVSINRVTKVVKGGQKPEFFGSCRHRRSVGESGWLWHRQGERSPGGH